MPGPVLTPDQREEVLRLLAAGTSQQSVARLLGIAQSTVNRIAKAARVVAEEVTSR